VAARHRRKGRRRGQRRPNCRRAAPAPAAHQSSESEGGEAPGGGEQKGVQEPSRQKRTWVNRERKGMRRAGWRAADPVRFSGPMKSSSGPFFFTRFFCDFFFSFSSFSFVLETRAYARMLLGKKIPYYDIGTSGRLEFMSSEKRKVSHD
jgi:hypothetical protein